VAGEATTWLFEHGFLDDNEQLSEAGRSRLVAFRESLRGLLLSVHNGEPGGEANTEALNELAATVPLRARFDPGGEPHLTPAAEVGDVVEEATGRILAIVVLSTAEGTWRRLKACRNEGCLWAFYDRSKNRSGSWFTMRMRLSGQDACLPPAQVFVAEGRRLALYYLGRKAKETMSALVTGLRKRKSKPGKVSASFEQCLER
jgi:hypothetical protein